jgi:hypothetical protein
VADRTWGVLPVLEGAVVFAGGVTPPLSVRLAAGDEQPIPPGVPHQWRVDEPVRLEIDFLVRQRPVA